MVASEIAPLRLRAQRLLAPAGATPADVVRWLGAVQAQDYPMSRWAVGARLPGSTDAAVAAAIDGGTIIRTHILRPTWHLVAATDIRWLLALSAPRVRTTLGSAFRQLELDTGVFTRSHGIIEQALAGHQHLTRAELMTRLAQAGIPTNDLRAAHLMYHAELAGLVCNGAMRGKQLTYALLDERVPAAPSLPRAEAVAELVRRYFTSHGPATERDFAWWSGLTLTDTRAGLAANHPTLTSTQVDGITYWFADEGPAPAADATAHWLPAYDEYLVSYADRRAALDPAFLRTTISVNGIFKPVVVVGGQVAGIWKRTTLKGRLRLEPTFFTAVPASAPPLLAAAAQRYGAFMGHEVTLADAPLPLS